MQVIISLLFFFCFKSSFAWHPKFENNLRLEQNDLEILFVFIRQAVLLGEVRRVNCRELKSKKQICHSLKIQIYSER